MFKLSILITTTFIMACQQDRLSVPAQKIPLILKSDLIEEVKVSKKTKIKKGEGLFSAMERIDLYGKEALSIVNNLRDEIELSAVMPGNTIEVTKEGNQLKTFSFENSLLKKHFLDRQGDKWIYRVAKKVTTIDHVKIEGYLRKNSTLEQDLISNGLSKESSNEVISALMCKINFRLHARQGDFFKVLLEREKLNNDVISLKPIYIIYNGKVVGSHETFYYVDEKSSTYSAHYLEDGQALIRSGLRFPLRKMHIRSQFGYRVHPVTGKRAFHRGVDLRGRNGDPVYSVAPGRIVSSSFNKYAGNTLAIRHKDGSISHYYHLLKKLVRKGQWVRGREKIGSVGSSGRVTGAHLHFGFQDQNGKWINPMSKRMIATPKLVGKRLEKLKNQIKNIRETLYIVENELQNNVLLVKAQDLIKN